MIFDFVLGPPARRVPALPRDLCRAAIVSSTLTICGLLSGCNFVDGRSESFHDRVEPARASFLSAIGGDLQNGATISPSGYMVRSTRFLNVYFVAGRVEANGADSWCVWALGGGAASGLPTSIVAAEDVAAQVSDCGKGDSSGEWISSDKEVAELLAYAQRHG